MTKKLKLNFDTNPSFVLNFKRLNYKPWYAIAEFIDNSLGSYDNNKKVLDAQYKKEKAEREIRISYSHKDSCFEIYDNSIGIDLTNLTRCVQYAEAPPASQKGKSQYGMGLKTAGWWLGDIIKIETTFLGEPVRRTVIMDCNQVAKGNTEYDSKEESCDADEHYTKIEVTQLDKAFLGPGLKKVKDVLCSMYNREMSNNGVTIYWDENILEPLKLKLHKNIKGEEYKNAVDIKLPGGKTVKGFLGILEMGKGGDSGRPRSGFQIFCNNRGIKIPPHAWKPYSIFREDSNDLINQRIFGELDFVGFEPNHQKDDISWQGDEQRKVEAQLKKILTKKGADLESAAKGAKSPSRKRASDNDLKLESDKVKEKLETGKYEKYMNKSINTNLKLKNFTKSKLVEDVTEKNNALKLNDITIGEDTESIKIELYARDVSPYEPYCSYQPSTEDNKILVIINRLHPIMDNLSSGETGLLMQQIVFDAIVDYKMASTGLFDTRDASSVLIDEKDELMQKKYISTN